jgi:hypothetical protein
MLIVVLHAVQYIHVLCYRSYMPQRDRYVMIDYVYVQHERDKMLSIRRRHWLRSEG